MFPNSLFMSFSSLTHLKFKYCSWPFQTPLQFPWARETRTIPKMCAHILNSCKSDLYISFGREERSLTYFRKGALGNQQAQSSMSTTYGTPGYSHLKITFRIQAQLTNIWYCRQLSIFNILSTIGSRAHGKNLRTGGSQTTLFLLISSDNSESQDNSQPCAQGLLTITNGSHQLHGACFLAYTQGNTLWAHT